MAQNNPGGQNVTDWGAVIGDALTSEYDVFNTSVHSRHPATMQAPFASGTPALAMPQMWRQQQQLFVQQSANMTPDFRTSQPTHNNATVNTATNLSSSSHGSMPHTGTMSMQREFTQAEIDRLIPWPINNFPTPQSRFPQRPQVSQQPTSQHSQSLARGPGTRLGSPIDLVSSTPVRTMHFTPMQSPALAQGFTTSSSNPQTSSMNDGLRHQKLKAEYQARLQQAQRQQQLALQASQSMNAQALQSQQRSMYQQPRGLQQHRAIPASQFSYTQNSTYAHQPVSHPQQAIGSLPLTPTSLRDSTSPHVPYTQNMQKDFNGSPTDTLPPQQKVPLPRLSTKASAAKTPAPRMSNKRPYPDTAQQAGRQMSMNNGHTPSPKRVRMAESVISGPNTPASATARPASTPQAPVRPIPQPLADVAKEASNAKEVKEEQVSLVSEAQRAKDVSQAPSLFQVAIPKTVATEEEQLDKLFASANTVTKATTPRPQKGSYSEGVWGVKTAKAQHIWQLSKIERQVDRNKISPPCHVENTKTVPKEEQQFRKLLAVPNMGMGTTATPPQYQKGPYIISTLERLINMSSTELQSLLAYELKKSPEAMRPKQCADSLVTKFISGPVTEKENAMAILEGVKEKMKRLGPACGSNPVYNVPAEPAQLLKIHARWTLAFAKQSYAEKVGEAYMPATAVMRSAMKA